MGVSKNKYWAIAFLTIALTSITFAVPTMNYSIGKIDSSIEECISTAKISLTNTGYKNIQTTSQHSVGNRGEFFTTVICASSGVVVIVTTGTNSSPTSEMTIVSNEFQKNLKNK